MGFIGYTKSILESSPRISLIPTLHSNQSSIENLFSCIRRMSKDRTDKYASGIIEQNLHKSIKCDAIPRGNASYPSSMIGIETNRLIDPNGISTEKRLGETVNQYKELVRLMIQKQGVAKINDDETLLFPSTSKLQPRLVGFDMFHMFEQHALKNKKHFQQTLIDNNAFATYAVICADTKKLKIFELLISNIHTDKVQMLYQHIIMELYIILTSATSLNKTVQSFEHKVLTIM